MATFIVGGGETSCMEVMGFDKTRIDILSKKEIIRTSCRSTCGYCGEINPSYPESWGCHIPLIGVPTKKIKDYVAMKNKLQEKLQEYCLKFFLQLHVNK